MTAISTPISGSDRPYWRIRSIACGPDARPTQAMKVARPISFIMSSALGWMPGMPGLRAWYQPNTRPVSKAPPPVPSENGMPPSLALKPPIYTPSTMPMLA
ncbi:hypothetical protein D3C72_2290650 [compost metagenome]